MTSFYCLTERINQILARRLRHQFLGFLAFFFVLTTVSPAFSQACYAPISGSAVQVGYFANSEVCVGPLCVGSTNYNTLQRITDNSLSTYANAFSILSALNGKDVIVRNTQTTYPSGYIAGFVLGQDGLVNLTVFSNLTIKTYNDGTATGDSKTLNELIGGSLLQGGEKIYATFKTTHPFDEVRLESSGIDVSTLSNLRIYAALAFPDNCTTDPNAGCADFIQGPNTDATFTGNATCVGCVITNKSNLTNGNSSDFASLVLPAAILSTATVGVIDLGQKYPAGHRTGFILSPDAANTLLSANLLNSVTLETYLYGQIQDTKVFSGGTGLDLSLLNASENRVKQKVSFITTKDFNEVRIKFNKTVAADLGTVRIYGAFEEPATCAECQDALLGTNTGLLSGSVVSAETGLYIDGIGVTLGSLTQTNQVVLSGDGNYAIYNLVVGVNAGARITVKNNGTDFPANTTFAGFRISKNGGLIDLALLDAITITVFRDGNAVQSSTSANLLGLGLLGNNSSAIATVGFYPTVAFDQIQIQIEALAGLAANYRIYNAFVIQDTDGDGIPDCNDSLCTGDNSLDYDGDGLPDACDPDDDNDGIYDTEENPGNSLRDTDSDGLPDYHDLDSDNDGILDTVEKGGDSTGINPVDTDGDGKKDYIDLDSDNDSINDVIESNGTDTDNNGKADGTTDPATGIPTSADTNMTLPNTDGDGLPDYRDLDTDGDGIFDLYESGAPNPGTLDGATKDGKIEAADGGDNDGIPQNVDGAPGAFGDADSPALPDNDGDKISNYRDLDSDNDGIPDSIERGSDGTNPTNTDGDNLPDYLDLDSDNDGINDVVEATGNPTNDGGGDGIADGPPSATGIPDSAGPNGVTNPNDADADGTPNYQDLDSDNDGIKDLYESGIDDPSTKDGATKDGKIEDADGADNDGIPQNVDGAPATYGDANTPTLPDGDTDNTPDYVDPAAALAPDLYPALEMPDRLIPANGGTKDLNVKVYNLIAGSTTNATSVTITITKPSPFYTLALTTDEATSNQWTLTTEGLVFKLVSNPAVVISGQSFNQIDLKLTVSGSAAPGLANLNINIIGGSGGETNFGNNVATAQITIE